MVSAVQLPAILVASFVEPLLALALAGVYIAWMTVLARSRLLRAWTVRLPVETIADLLRVLFFTLAVQGLVLWLCYLPQLAAIGVQVLTFLVLTVHALFLRGAPASWVRILGSSSNLGSAVSTFDRCMDLLGREGCRFAPFRADRPEPEAWERRIRAWVDRGETVLVLEPQLRGIARRMYPNGDVVFAEDCLLFTPIRRAAGPRMDRMLNVLNRIIALVAILSVWPLALGIAMLIRLDDGGPVFFAQKRVGRDGREFTLYKFRTMKVDAPKYAVHPGENDPRVTQVGHWIRKVSLDELPQLANVLRGEMRLVGPRPEMPFLVAQYGEAERRRLAVAPGITGLWQVSPHRNDPIHEHIEYDLAYIAHRGPILDLALLIATAGLASGSGR